MAGQTKSRWAESAEDFAASVRRKREREEKKLAKLAKLQSEAAKESASVAAHDKSSNQEVGQLRPGKRRKLSPSRLETKELEQVRFLKRPATRQWNPCRHVDNFENLNHIEEGSYGLVSRAREIATAEIVALKKLKFDDSVEGFPTTALREVQTLRMCSHRHVVDLREVVVGTAPDDVFLVMEFIEHDLRTLQEDMLEPFLPSEIKTLLLQLGSAVEHLHSHWILHRDLKTSNILLNNRGEIKIADFGMARFTSLPSPSYLTQLVVTLWYRAPELLLGTTTYDTAIDMWSIGCIFGELVNKEPLLPGKNEVDELSKIFELCGIPTEDSWPGFRRLPHARSLRLPHNSNNNGSIIRSKFPLLTNAGSGLLDSLLSLNPSERPSATEMLHHAYFKEDPRPKSTAMFPTFPSKAGQEKRRRNVTPSAPRGGAAPKFNAESLDFSNIFSGRENEERGPGFQLKLI